MHPRYDISQSIKPIIVSSSIVVAFIFLVLLLKKGRQEKKAVDQTQRNMEKGVLLIELNSFAHSFRLFSICLVIFVRLLVSLFSIPVIPVG